LKENDLPPVIFTTKNEPYLGRESVYHFDEVIISCLDANKHVAAFTKSHKDSLNELQLAACQIIPQGINIALSIRELIRQGYLFGAVVLMRPLVERAGIISYLHEKPEKVTVWKNGWKKGEGRPALYDMMKNMSKGLDESIIRQTYDFLNSVDHGDPVGSQFSLIDLGNGELGYAVSKILNDPEFCDFICYQAYCYLIILMSRMVAIFPEAKIKKSKPHVKNQKI
jgi:hypothetical protein